MPKKRYNIGTAVTNSLYGTCVVVGNYDGNNDINMLHLYSFKKETFIYLEAECITKISDNEPELLQKAQTALLPLITNSANKDIGIHTIYRTRSLTIEYLQLTNSYEINNHKYALFAYRDYSTNNPTKWSLTYRPIDHNHTTVNRVLTNGLIRQQNPDTIQQAKQLLLEKVILPAFTAL